jgi:molybdopterin converting factor small subunit
MIVHIPSPLQSYTKQKLVDGSGNSVAELLNNLNEKYPGIRFRMIDEQDRIRQHIRIFVNKKPVSKLDLPVQPADEVHIICALSGG